MLNFRDDPAAFRAFISEQQDKVYNLVLNRIQNAQDAEEVTQDVFIAVFQKPEAFRGDSAVTTWLYRIAINKCIDHLRKKQSNRRGSFLKIFDNDDKQVVNARDLQHPGVLTENKEKSAILFNAMNKLPAKQHTAWVLSEIENFSYKEISEIMNVSVSSVESLLFRARQNLKKILKRMYPGKE